MILRRNTARKIRIDFLQSKTSVHSAHAEDIEFYSPSRAILKDTRFFFTSSVYREHAGMSALLIRDGQKVDIGHKRYDYNKESTQVADPNKEKATSFAIRKVSRVNATTISGKLFYIFNTLREITQRNLSICKKANFWGNADV